MIARIPVEAFVGLGANLENPVQQVSQAVIELGGIDHTRLLAASSLYRSDPVGYWISTCSHMAYSSCRRKG